MERFSVNPEDHDMSETSCATLDRMVAERRVGFDHSSRVGGASELHGRHPQELDVTIIVTFSTCVGVPILDFLKIATTMGREINGQIAWDSRHACVLSQNCPSITTSEYVFAPALISSWIWFRWTTPLGVNRSSKSSVSRARSSETTSTMYSSKARRRKYSTSASRIVVEDVLVTQDASPIRNFDVSGTRQCLQR